MSRHVFSFEGGDDLTTMGACWFVSYCYYKFIDPNHRNWDRVSTSSNRISVFTKTKKYHKYWLSEILNMNNSNLNKNSLGLSSFQIKEMAEALLAKM